MKIAIIGTGYVGLVTGTCFSEMGNKVYCVDIDETKIKKLETGEIPIYEPGLTELVIKNHKKHNLYFTTDLKEALDNSDICFIAVGTPMEEDGSADLRYVLNTAKQIGESITHDLIVVDKSTVPVGTAEKVKNTIQNELDMRNVNHKISVIANPEFLKEGNAVEDFTKPDRIIIGSDDDEVTEIMRELYAPFTPNREQFIAMDIKSAEMSKYAANAMLATRISFMNEIANICERVGANVNNVRIGMGSDDRIGSRFLYAGCGYGGSCFPKDVRALIKTGQEHDYECGILREVDITNNKQKLSLVNKIVKRFGKDLNGLTFGVWGLSFKPGTDDMREAPSIVIIENLINMGAKIKVYDPRAMNVAKEFYFKDNTFIEFQDEPYGATENVDSLILVTEWKEFRSPDFELMLNKMKQKIIFDGRNQYNKHILNKFGFEYYQIGTN